MPKIELRGGPLDGLVHEVEPGFPVPDRFGLIGPPPGQHRRSRRHWYIVREDKCMADYDCSEEAEPPLKK